LERLPLCRHGSVVMTITEMLESSSQRQGRRADGAPAVQAVFILIGLSAAPLQSQGGERKGYVTDRVFKILQNDLALRQLGLAVVLKWKDVPRVLQEALVEQAAAAGGGQKDPEIGAVLNELLRVSKRKEGQ